MGSPRVFKCITDERHDKPMDHAPCVEAGYKSVTSTRTCMTTYDAIFRNKFSHDKCGELCPGPNSEAFKYAQRSRNAKAGK